MGPHQQSWTGATWARLILLGVTQHMPQRAQRAAPPRRNQTKAKPRWQARCGDGCLDRLVVTIRNARPFKLRTHDHPSVLAREQPRAAAAVAAAAAARMRPLVLLGVLSGSRERRDLLRCTWMRPGHARADTSAGVVVERVRMLFIVGRNASEGGPDMFEVDVAEGARMRAAGQERGRTVRGVKTGSITTYWKLAAWFKHAATQPEPFIGRADDDVFISPRMLAAHAMLLLDRLGPAGRAAGRGAGRGRGAGKHGGRGAGGRGGASKPGGRGRRELGAANGTEVEVPLVYAGVFEWYNWRTATLHSTGFGFSAGAARKRSHSPWRNCTPGTLYPQHAAATHVYGSDDVCVGPVAFAKGPLMLLSRSATRALVSSPPFERDLARAAAMSDGRAAAFSGPGTGRIDDDVQLG